MSDDNEYLDIDYFLYISLIVEYTNNLPRIVSCCENILNGTYLMYTQVTVKKNNKCKLLCVNNKEIDKNKIDDIEIYNKDSLFIKNIIQSEYIDLKELWEIPNKKIYILYTILTNDIVPVMVSENKDKIMSTFKSLHDIYLICLHVNIYYKSMYEMEECIYKL